MTALFEKPGSDTKPDPHASKKRDPARGVRAVCYSLRVDGLPETVTVTSLVVDNAPSVAIARTT